MSFKRYIKKNVIRQIAGVTVHYLKNNEYAIYFVILKFEKNKLKIIKSQSGIDSFDSLASEIGKSTPVWLTVTGRPVISRKLTDDPGEKYLHAILPNARETEFTVSVAKENNGEVFVSAIRKDNLETLNGEFHSVGLKILGYSVGPACIGALISAGLLIEKVFTIPGYKIELKNDRISEIATDENITEEAYLIGTDRISADLILPLASSFSYLMYQTGYDKLVTESPISDDESIFFSQVNRYFLLAALIIVFGLLLVNFLIFNYYNSKEQILTAEVSYENTVFAESDSLRREILLKKNLVEQIGLSQNTTYGFFADRIASTVPTGIQLQLLSINPITSKVKEDKVIQFERLIMIKGETNGSMLLNEWIKDLGKFSWIKNIEIIGYEKTDVAGEFEIKISY